MKMAGGSKWREAAGQVRDLRLHLRALRQEGRAAVTGHSKEGEVGASVWTRSCRAP